MDSALIRRARTIFLAALEKPAADRDAFVRHQCGEEDALYRRVIELLHHAADDAGPDGGGHEGSGFEDSGFEDGAGG